MKTLITLVFIMVLNFYCKSQTINKSLEVNANDTQLNNNVILKDSLITKDYVNSNSNNSTYKVGEIKFIPKLQSQLNRKIISTYIESIQTNLPGNVTLNVCINRNGKITFTEILIKESTITDISILKEVMKASRRFKFDTNKSAPAEQCGKLIINLGTKY